MRVNAKFDLLFMLLNVLKPCYHHFYEPEFFIELIFFEMEGVPSASASKGCTRPFFINNKRKQQAQSLTKRYINQPEATVQAKTRYTYKFDEGSGPIRAK